MALRKATRSERRVAFSLSSRAEVLTGMLLSTVEAMQGTHNDEGDGSSNSDKQWLPGAFHVVDNCCCCPVDNGGYIICICGPV